MLTLIAVCASLLAIVALLSGDRRLAIVFMVVAAVVFVLSVDDARAAGYPCAGVPATAPRTTYDEPRLYVEGQAWWTPMPTTGDTGHLHIAACWPLYQHVTQLPLDFKWQVHDNHELVHSLRVDAGTVVGGAAWTPMICPVAQCEGWTHYDAPVAALPGGWRSFNPFLQETFGDGRSLRNVNEWPVYLDNGRPPLADGYDTAYSPLGGESWFNPDCDMNGCGSKYARSFLAADELAKLWDEDTGQLVALNSPTTISTWGDKPYLRVMIDPAFHADPPSAGMVLVDSAVQQASFTIDPNMLAPGPHRLVIENRFYRAAGAQSGLLAVPFVVAGRSDLPAPPPDVAPDRVAFQYGTTVERGDEKSLADDDGDSLDIRSTSPHSTTAGWFAYYPAQNGGRLLHLKAAAGRPCGGTVATSTAAGWRIAAYVSLAPQWAMFDVPVPGGTTGVRLLCTSGDRPTISTEQAVLR